MKRAVLLIFFLEVSDTTSHGYLWLRVIAAWLGIDVVA